MNRLRSLAFVVWMYGLLVVMGIACAPALLGPRTWSRACLDAWLKLVFWGLRAICGITWEVRGLEHVPAGGALIASKHQSMFDTLAPWTFLADPAIILKKELSYLPIFGWYAMKMQNIVVDRAANAAALRTLLKDARARAADGRQILIFPEGTRTNPGDRVDYKPGVAALYKDLGVPCVPIALNSGLCWPGKGVDRTPGRIVVEILEPLEPGLDRATFMTTLHERIETASAALAAGATTGDAT